MRRDHGIIDRKITADPLIDVVIGRGHKAWYTALQSTDTNRLFAIEPFTLEVDAKASYAAREVKYRSYDSEFNEDGTYNPMATRKR